VAARSSGQRVPTSTPPVGNRDEGAPAPAPGRRRRGAALALAVVLVALVAVVAVVAGGTASDRARDADADRASDAADDAPVSTRPTTSSTTVAPPAPTPAGETVTVAAPDGTFVSELPASWVRGFTGTGVPLAEQMFPGDEFAASQMHVWEDVVVTPQTRLLAFDPDDWSVLPHSSVVVDGMTGVDPAAIGLDALVASAKESFTGDGPTLGAEGRLPGSSGEVGWFEIHISGGLDGVRYVVTGSDSVWLLTYWSDDMAATRPQGDAIATSFDPG
jgi:hypothetical protein